MEITLASWAGWEWQEEAQADHNEWHSFSYCREAGKNEAGGSTCATRAPGHCVMLLGGVDVLEAGDTELQHHGW